MSNTNPTKTSYYFEDFFVWYLKRISNLSISMGTNCSPTCSSLRVRFKEILMKNENNKNMIPTRTSLWWLNKALCCKKHHAGYASSSSYVKLESNYSWTSFKYLNRFYFYCNTPANLTPCTPNTIKGNE